MKSSIGRGIRSSIAGLRKLGVFFPARCAVAIVAALSAGPQAAADGRMHAEIERQLAEDGTSRVIIEVHSGAPTVRDGVRIAGPDDVTTLGGKVRGVVADHFGQSSRSEAIDLKVYEKSGVIVADLDRAQIAKLTADGRIASISPNRRLHPSMIAARRPSSRGEIESRAFTVRNLSGAGNAVSAYGQTGKGKTIILIDSGVDLSIRSVAATVDDGACFSTHKPKRFIWSACRNNARSGRGKKFGASCDATIADCAHGSAVASVAAGRHPGFDGTAPDAKIFSINAASLVCRDETSRRPNCKKKVTFFEEDVIRAVEFIDTLVSAKPKKYASVNMSFGEGLYSGGCDTPDSSRFRLINSKIGLVAAAGNENGYFKWARNWPACSFHVVSIAALQASDAADRTYEAWSESATLGTNYSEQALVGADVPIMTRAGASLGSGTSLSAPQVAAFFTMSPNFLRRDLMGWPYNFEGMDVAYTGNGRSYIFFAPRADATLSSNKFGDKGLSGKQYFNIPVPAASFVQCDEWEEYCYAYYHTTPITRDTKYELGVSFNGDPAIYRTYTMLAGRDFNHDKIYTSDPKRLYANSAMISIRNLTDPGFEETIFKVDMHPRQRK